MKKKRIFKHLFPLILSFLGAFVFFASYNHYLLDSSLANLKISLKKLGRAENFSEVRSILNDTFIMEITRGDFDLAAAVKLELSAEMAKKIPPEQQAKNKRYITNMNSAAEIDFSSDILKEISRQTQLKDVKHLIKDVIVQKTGKKSVFISKLEDFIITLFPQRRRVNPKGVLVKIKGLKESLDLYKGEALQEKYLEIARLYLRLKDLNRAVGYINKSLNVNSENFLGLKAQFYLGILYKIRGDYEISEAIFKTIKKKLPQDWRAFSAYQQASALLAMGKKREAAGVLEKSFDENPSLEIAQLSQFRAGHIYLYDLGDEIAAREALARLAEKSPDTRWDRYARYKISKDIADSYIYKGFEFLKEGYKLLKEGLISTNIDKFGKALEQFHLALEIDSNNALAYSGRGLVYYFLNKYEDALGEVRKARDIASGQGEVREILGFIYYKLEMIDEAIAEYEKTVKIGSISEVSHYNLATLYALKKNYPKAKVHFATAIKINPKFAKAYNNLGYIFWLQGRYEEAKGFFKSSLSLEPDYIDARYNLGVTLYASGKYEEAREELERVKASKPQYRKTEFYLIQIKNKLGY